jgi:hypothetical protein
MVEPKKPSRHPRKSSDFTSVPTKNAAFIDRLTTLLATTPGEPLLTALGVGKLIHCSRSRSFSYAAAMMLSMAVAASGVRLRSRRK